MTHWRRFVPRSLRIPRGYGYCISRIIFCAQPDIGAAFKDTTVIDKNEPAETLKKSRDGLDEFCGREREDGEVPDISFIVTVVVLEPRFSDVEGWAGHSFT
jgi:hypothetical protein